MGIVCGYTEYKDYFDNSQPFLESCDMVVVCEKSENSKGTKRETDRARELGITVISIETFKNCFKEDKTNG